MRARPLVRANSDRPKRDIPVHLAAALTRHEPYRTQALTDARLFLATPLLAGIGLEFELVSPLEPFPYAHWSETISPLQIRLTWMRTMAGDQIDWAYEGIERVAFEDGEWRIVCFWNDVDRDIVLKMRQFF